MSVWSRCRLTTAHLATGSGRRRLLWRNVWCPLGLRVEMGRCGEPQQWDGTENGEWGDSCYGSRSSSCVHFVATIRKEAASVGVYDFVFGIR
jgi:hypothetical protein